MNEKKDNEARFQSNCVILVRGQYASGKKSLIEVLHCSCKTEQFVKLIEADSERKEDISEEKHCIWYCVDGAKGLALADMSFVRNADSKTLIVITKRDVMNCEQNKILVDFLAEYIAPERIIVVSSKKKIGLDRLLDKTHDICLQSVADSTKFEAWWEKFYQPLKENFSRSASDEADRYINWAAGRAAVIALVPLPLADTVPLIANEIHLIHKLASLYGMSADKSTITTIIGCVGGSLVGKLTSGILPVAKIPVASGVTYGIGKAAKAYFESGKTIDATALRDCFLDAVCEAKNMVWGKTQD